jgi:hypothetical protein
MRDKLHGGRGGLRRREVGEGAGVEIGEWGGVKGAKKDREGESGVH